MEALFPLFPLFKASLAATRDDESALLQRARNGEVAALEWLLDCHRERIVNLAFQILHDRETADDAAQEAFVRAFSRLSDFRGESSFGSWLYRIALNICLEKRRRARPKTEAEQDCAATQRDVSWQIETRIALETTLESLAEPLRVALILREWHGLSYEEMALVLAIPVGTVRSRLHQARGEFRQIWQKMEAE